MEKELSIMRDKLEEQRQLALAVAAEKRMRQEEAAVLGGIVRTLQADQEKNEEFQHDRWIG